MSTVMWHNLTEIITDCLIIFSFLKYAFCLVSVEENKLSGRRMFRWALIFYDYKCKEMHTEVLLWE